MFDKATNIELKRINRNNIYRTVIAQKKTSKQEIAYQLNLSLPTVTQNLNELWRSALWRRRGLSNPQAGERRR